MFSIVMMGRLLKVWSISLFDLFFRVLAIFDLFSLHSSSYVTSPRSSLFLICSISWLKSPAIIIFGFSISLFSCSMCCDRVSSVWWLNYLLSWLQFIYKHTTKMGVLSTYILVLIKLISCMRIVLSYYYLIKILQFIFEFLPNAGSDVKLLYPFSLS